MSIEALENFVDHIEESGETSGVDAQEEHVYHLKELMKNNQTRAAVYNLLVRTGYFLNVFDPDPHTHDYNAGKRSNGVELVNDLMLHCNDEYKQMIEENEHG